jgi:hypothetical protein
MDGLRILHFHQQHGNGIVRFPETEQAVFDSRTMPHPLGTRQVREKPPVFAQKTLPGTGILHRYPRFGWCEAFAFLQNFE